MQARAFLIGTAAHMTPIAALRQTATATAKQMMAIPEHEATSIGELSRLLRIEKPADIA